MSAVIRDGKHPLAELVFNPADFERVGRRLVHIVLHSFGVDRQRNPFAPAPTLFDTQYRSKVCLEWFKILRRDMHYSLEHSLDLLPHALRAKLDGVDFEPPPAGRMWAEPGAARPLQIEDEIIHDGAQTSVDEDGNPIVDGIDKLKDF